MSYYRAGRNTVVQNFDDWFTGILEILSLELEQTGVRLVEVDHFTETRGDGVPDFVDFAHNLKDGLLG